MKKLLLSAALFMGALNAQAQGTVPYIFTAVGDNTYAITQTLDDMKANYSADWISDSGNWGVGVTFPDGTVLFENDDMTVTAAGKSNVMTAYGKLTDIQKTYPTYTAYVNMGSTLGQNNWKGTEQIQDISSMAAGSQAILVVTPKKKGTLSFGVYAGDNSRSIGIYQLATEDEMDEDNFGGFLAYNNFRNEDSAPAYVEAAIAPGHSFAMIAGAQKNLNMHHFKFVPDGDTDGVQSVSAAAQKQVKAVYTLGGAQLSAPVKGVNIVVYSDGTSAKVIK